MTMADPGGAPARPRRSVTVRALLLAAAAVLLHAPFVGWGAPHATAPDRTLTFATDDVLPLGPLAEMHNTFVESKPDRNYAYPWWHYFVLSAAQAPYLGWLKLTGGLEAPSPTFPFGMRDPVAALRTLTVIGRLVSVAMTAGIVACAYIFARTLWSERAGVLAGLLALVNPWLAYYGRTGNLDAPATFWTALGLVAFAHVLRSGLEPKRAAWLGVFAGVAMATKDQALAVFLPLALVLLVPPLARGADGRWAGRAVLAALGASVAAFVVCTGMPVDPIRQVTHVERLFFQQGTLTAAHAYWQHEPLSLASAGRLALGFARGLGALLTWPGLAAALVGLGLALGGRAGGRPRDATPALSVPATFVLLVLALGIVVKRYLVPLALPLDALAAFALTAAAGARWRAVGTAAAVAILALRAGQTLDLSWAQLSETRAEAARWIAEHARPGDRLEYFGHGQKLPHLPADVESRRILGRGTEWEGERDHGPAVLAYLAGDDAPELVAVIPDWTSKPGMPRSEDCPPEVFAALEAGTAGFRRVASFPSPSLLPPPFARPVLDSPSVAPPVRLYARDDVASRP